jgi:hypothetical protein
MESALSKINDYSGTLQLLVIIIGIVMFFTNMSTSMEKNNKNNDRAEVVHEKQVEALREATYLLKKTNEDHIQFVKYIDRNTIVTQGLREATIKLDATMMSLRDELKHGKFQASFREEL